MTVTGAVYDGTTGMLTGFYIADSGRQLVSDMTRYIDINLFRQAVNVPNAYSIYTVEALKLWNEDINGTGNALNNVIDGNRGNNVIAGGAGNDTIYGEGGDDTLTGGTGNDTLTGGDGVDTFVFHKGDGQDAITDFAATGTAHDIIQIDPALVTSWTDLLSKSTQSGANVVIAANTNDKITLNNVAVSSLTVDNFRFQA